VGGGGVTVPNYYTFLPNYKIYKASDVQCAPNKLRPLNIVTAFSTEYAAPWNISVCLAYLLLMLTIFHHPETKTLCSESSLQKKDACNLSNQFFSFFTRKLALQGVFVLVE
jgi:hypothetical protein